MKTIRSRYVWATCAALLVAAFGGSLLYRAHRGPLLLPPTTIGWTVGMQYSYGFRWEASQRIQLFAGASGAANADSVTDLSGKMLVRCVGTQNKHLLLSVELTDIDRHFLQMLGQEYLPDADSSKALLTGHPVVFEFDRHGHLVQVHRKSDENPLVVGVLQTLMLRAQITLPESSAPQWTTSEQTTLGVSRVAYQVQANAPETVLARKRTQYDVLDSLSSEHPAEQKQVIDSWATVALDRSAVPNEVRDKEKLQVFVNRGSEPTLAAFSDFEWHKLDQGPIQDKTPLSLEGWIAQPPAAAMIQDPAQQSAKLLSQRIAGLTLQDMVKDIELFAAAGKIPDQSRWLTRATGLLLQHPEYCDSLLEVFQQELMTSEGQGLILDLLASVGSPKAQAIMREAINSDAARQNKKAYSLLVQRFLFVQSPTSETLAFLDGKLDDALKANSLDARAYANSLASAAGKAVRAGSSEASGYNNKVVQLLEQAKTPEDRKSYLGALGNTRMPENAPVLQRYAKDPDPTVRAAAAYAMRYSQDSGSRQTLTGLASDADRSVGESALSALEQQQLGRADIERLAQLVIAGQTAPLTDSHMVNVLSTYLGSSPLVRQALVFLLARNQGNSDITARIMGALSRA